MLSTLFSISETDLYFMLLYMVCNLNTNYGITTKMNQLLLEVSVSPRLNALYIRAH